MARRLGLNLLQHLHGRLHAETAVSSMQERLASEAAVEDAVARIRAKRPDYAEMHERLYGTQEGIIMCDQPDFQGNCDLIPLEQRKWRPIPTREMLTLGEYEAPTILDCESEGCSAPLCPKSAPISLSPDRGVECYLLFNRTASEAKEYNPHYGPIYFPGISNLADMPGLASWYQCKEGVPRWMD
ncbi:uncharacterized protein AB675_4095 [Cyphellophora attinorum]|uniref:Uncharacterized protein n=1 Tax=Cyphellophora attinorum TaxID=1664694 RepID=A0A0N1H6T9_9EURO|nr:uncharacterized protein AB675_4095 [Phialophora attinorum]KPI38524.1 hypothetical protein AB675_4095 [Phialophora attinorum]